MKKIKIYLTKKLADAIGVSSTVAQENENPLFYWTANWTKVWSNRRTEDMIVLVNNATRFVVALYQVKRKDLRNVAGMMKSAIKNTMLDMNINPEIVEEYFRQAGELEFTKNHNRQAASWVTRAGEESAIFVEREYNGIDKIFNDRIGIFANHRIVNYAVKDKQSFVPYKAMNEALYKLTGKQLYKYRAFELLITLDLEIYKATRRVIVSANLEFERLHKVIQRVFRWYNYHLYDFTIYSNDGGKKVVRLVPFEEELDYDEDAILMRGHTLSEFLPEHKQMVYTYDKGDNWEHEIQLISVFEEYGEESPCLMEAIGQAPPEDVGSVEDFIEFRKIMLNPSHPEYETMKRWSRYWSIELDDWQCKPKIVDISW